MCGALSKVSLGALYAIFFPLYSCFFPLYSLSQSVVGDLEAGPLCSFLGRWMCVADVGCLLNCLWSVYLALELALELALKLSLERVFGT